MTEDWCSNQVIVNDLGNFASVDIAQQIRLGIARIQDGRLTDIELDINIRLSAIQVTFGTVSSLSCIFR